MELLGILAKVVVIQVGISEPLHRYLIQDDTLFRMQSAVIYSHLTEGTGMVLGKLRRVSLTQTNRPGMKQTPILSMSLPTMGFELGVVKRPEITSKASMFEEAGWLSPGQLPELMLGKRSDVLAKLMQVVRFRAGP